MKRINGMSQARKDVCAKDVNRNHSFSGARFFALFLGFCLCSVLPAKSKSCELCV